MPDHRQRQISGIGTDVNGWHDEASWALGWRVLGTDRWEGFDSDDPMFGEVDLYQDMITAARR